MTEQKNIPSSNPPIIGITLGDLNGIGPEIVIKTLEDSRISKLFTPVIYGNHKLINRYKKLLGSEDFQMQPCRTASTAAPRKINMLNCWDHDYEIKPGEMDPEAGKLAWEGLKKAAQDLKTGEIQALVTGPINKSNMPKEDFPYPGHTEFFAEMAGVKESLMVMVSEHLRVALATVHLPLEKVASKLNRNLIFNRISELEKTLFKDFMVKYPKIAVLGFNPHAGENGKMGIEEETVIGPAIKDLRDKGKHVYGPFPADGFFASGQFSKFDGILAMYHDQGLIPFKVLAGYGGVNYSAGLPFIRVSPDHGTGFDIAGKNEANPDSLRNAIFLALDIIRNREDSSIELKTGKSSVQSSGGAD
jgi:4-hydroxythreonine-4-phosphate dehydrogenase